MLRSGSSVQVLDSVKKSGLDLAVVMVRLWEELKGMAWEQGSAPWKAPASELRKALGLGTATDQALERRWVAEWVTVRAALWAVEFA